jgi:hypothetical protein
MVLPKKFGIGDVLGALPAGGPGDDGVGQPRKQHAIDATRSRSTWRREARWITDRI